MRRAEEGGLLTVHKSWMCVWADLSSRSPRKILILEPLERQPQSVNMTAMILIRIYTPDRVLVMQFVTLVSCVEVMNPRVKTSIFRVYKLVNP